MGSGSDLLAVDDAGEGAGDGPALVFVHGLTFSRGTWTPVVDALASSFRCVSVDLPGYGDSTGSAADPMAVVERLAATLAGLGVERPVLVGHSAGALTATGYAARFPAAAVVNVDQPLLVGGFASLLRQVEEGLRGPDFAAAFAPFEHSIGLHLLPEPERSRVAATRRVDQATVLDHWHLPLSVGPERAQATIDALLDAVDVPYLYVGGQEPADAVRAHLAAHLSRLEVVVHPGAGHLVHLADPARFARVVAEFVERVIGQRAGP